MAHDAPSARPRRRYSCAFSVALAAAGETAAPLVIVSGTVIDGTGRPPLPGGVIVIQDGTFVSVTSAGTGSPPADAGLGFPDRHADVLRRFKRQFAWAGAGTPCFSLATWMRLSYIDGAEMSKGPYSRRRSAPLQR